MSRIFIALLAVALLASVAFAQTQQWTAGWTAIAFMALLISYFIIGVAYMWAIGFSDSRLESWCRNEFYQTSATAFLLGALYGSSALLDTVVYPAFWSTSIMNPESAASRETPDFCGQQTIMFMGMNLPLSSAQTVNYGSANGFGTIQSHAAEWVSCMRSKLVLYYVELGVVSGIAGFFSSVWMNINPHYIAGAVSITPGVMLRPGVDILGYLSTALTLLIIQLRLQEMLVVLARDYMFTVVLPLGIALRSFTGTRMAGGALIAIAIGFYIALPITWIFQEEIVADYCRGGDCEMDLLESITLGGALQDIMFAMISAGENGDWASSARAMGASGGVSDLFSITGPMGPIVFVGIIGGVVLPVIGLIATFMFIKAIASILGADVDFSSLVKVI